MCCSDDGLRRSGCWEESSSRLQVGSRVARAATTRGPGPRAGRHRARTSTISQVWFMVMSRTLFMATPRRGMGCTWTSFHLESPATLANCGDDLLTAIIVSTPMSKTIECPSKLPTACGPEGRRVIVAENDWALHSWQSLILSCVEI